MMLQLFLLLNSCLSGIGGFLGSPITGWFAFAFAGVMVITLIIALIYAIGPMLGRPEIRGWARMKLYETMFALFLVIIFGGFATMVCTINPVGILGAPGVNLVPNSPIPPTTGAATSLFASGGSDCTAATDIYSLSECDLYNFNYNVVYFLTGVMSAATTLFSASTNIGIGYNFIPGVEGFGVQVTLGAQLIPLKLLAEAEATTIGSLILLSQVQLLLLDASMAIFAILLPMGLVARIFGVTRTFGGAMIAFALGLGVIFPIMIAINYGFLLQSINNLQLFTFLSNPLTINILSDITSISLDLLSYLGVAIVGLLILPLLTFTVVNTFILDFSQAVGERMDFLSLLTTIV